MNPNDTSLVFKIADEVRKNKSDATKLVQDYAMSNPEFKGLYEQLFISPKIDLNELDQLPKDTLGYAYARHMLDRNLKVDFYPNVEIKEPLDYWSLRMRQTHDIWHVLAGFDTSVVGELGLQAFSLGQTKSLFAGIILTGGIFSTVTRRPTQLIELFDSIQRGYYLGRNAKYLLGFKLELFWNKSLQQVRTDLGLAL